MRLLGRAFRDKDYFFSTFPQRQSCVGCELSMSMSEMVVPQNGRLLRQQIQIATLLVLADWRHSAPAHKFLKKGSSAWSYGGIGMKGSYLCSSLTL